MPPWPMGAVPPPPPPSRPRGPLVLGIIGGLAGVCVLCVAFGAYLEKKDKDTYGALAVVCTGQPVANAHAYAPTPGVHRVVAFVQRDGEWHVHNEVLPDEVTATGVADAELVACVGESTQTRIDTCSFVRTRFGIEVPGSERDYPRTQSQLPVRLLAATTGALVREGPVVGPKPHECSDYHGDPGASDFAGDDVGKNEFGGWLRGEVQVIPVEAPAANGIVRRTQVPTAPADPQPTQPNAPPPGQGLPGAPHK